MRTEIGCVALLLGTMGCVTSAAASENAAGVAGKRGPYYSAANQLADAPASAADSTTSSATLQGDAQGLLDYTQTLIEGEELMFIMDVPYVPAQDTPIVLAQAATPSVTPPPDYIFNACSETESTGDPMSAMRGVTPVGMLAAYIENHSQRLIDRATEAAIKLTLVEGTTQGKLNPHTTRDGRLYYMYDPTPNYIGNDRAVFLAEFEGKVYKIVVELKVQKYVDENTSLCPPPQLIKVTKPSSGDSGFGAGYDLASVSIRTIGDHGFC